MKKTLSVVLFLILCMPIYVLALPCTVEQNQKYETLAKEIQTTFDYEENNGDILFTINFHNVDKNLYLVDYNTKDYLIIYPNDNPPIISIPDAKANTTYTLSVLNDNKICDSMIVTNIKVTTPSYNKYYTDPLCEGVQTYSLCQKWNNVGNLSYNEFQKSLQNYKNQLEKDESNNNAIANDSNWFNIRNFIANNYIYIIIVISLLTFIVIILSRKRHKNDW